MSIEPNRVSKYRVNRVSMPMGRDSFFTFTLNHEGLSRMMAICFDPSEIYDGDSVGLLMQKIATMWGDMITKLSTEEIADAVARTDDPMQRDKILGLHLGRDPVGTLYFTPAHLHHAKECGWNEMGTP